MDIKQLSEHAFDIYFTCILCFHFPDCEQKMKIWAAKVKSPLFSKGALPLKCSYDIEGQNSSMNFTVSFEEFSLAKGNLILKHDNETLRNLTGKYLAYS